MIITIARECGAGGEVIGKLLSEKFNIPFYSWEILVEMANEKGLYEDMPTFFTEDPMNSLIYALSATVHSDKVKKTPLNALAKLLEGQDCIIIGRCGNFVFRNRGDCFSVFLHGDFEDRVASMAKKWKTTKAEAAKRVPKTDEYRSVYHKFYTGEQWGHSSYYDLTLDTYRLGFEKTTEYIADFIKDAGIKTWAELAEEREE